MRSASTVSMRSPTPACASSARPKRKMVSAAERRLFWGTAVAVVVSDFVSKLIAESFLARRLPLPIIGDTVQLRLVYNEGAAFGLHVGDNSRWIFMALAVVALFVLASLVRSTRPGDRFRLIALALVSGGGTARQRERGHAAGEPAAGIRVPHARDGGHGGPRGKGGAAVVRPSARGVAVRL